MEMERVCKGSVAVAGIEEHREETCMQRFCRDGRAGEIWRCNVYHKVLFQTCRF